MHHQQRQAAPNPDVATGVREAVDRDRPGGAAGVAEVVGGEDRDRVGAGTGEGVLDRAPGGTLPPIAEVPIDRPHRRPVLEGRGGEPDRLPDRRRGRDRERREGRAGAVEAGRLDDRVGPVFARPDRGPVAGRADRELRFERAEAELGQFIDAGPGSAGRLRPAVDHRRAGARAGPGGLGVPARVDHDMGSDDGLGQARLGEVLGRLPDAAVGPLARLDRRVRPRRPERPDRDRPPSGQRHVRFGGVLSGAGQIERFEPIAAGRHLGRLHGRRAPDRARPDRDGRAAGVDGDLRFLRVAARFGEFVGRRPRRRRST